MAILVLFFFSVGSGSAKQQQTDDDRCQIERVGLLASIWKHIFNCRCRLRQFVLDHWQDYKPHFHTLKICNFGSEINNRNRANWSLVSYTEPHHTASHHMELLCQLIPACAQIVASIASKRPAVARTRSRDNGVYRTFPTCSTRFVELYSCNLARRKRHENNSLARRVSRPMLSKKRSVKVVVCIRMKSGWTSRWWFYDDQ